jgi:beta-galactosidase/beta-glucuronidase
VGADIIKTNKLNKNKKYIIKEGKNMKTYKENYPRPQFVREQWECLNGSWQFAFDDDRQGEKEQWFMNFPNGQEIRVPFTYETKSSGIQDESVHETVWYQRMIQIDEIPVEKRLMIHFEGSDYITRVWVNGHYVGEHTGAYSRFSFDITEHLHTGSNRITVKAEDSLDERQPRGKQRWIPESYGCWYVQTTGIWKTVWMEWVPESHIVSLKMTPSVTKKNMELELQADMKQDGSLYEIEAVIEFEGTQINRMRMDLERPYWKGTMDVYCKKIFEWGIKTWSAVHPDLYDISFRLLRDKKVVDQVDSYFGMREISIRDQKVLMNGRPIYQRLILDQGYWKDSHLTPPDEEALKTDIRKIKELGYNGVRKHQKIEDERFLYWCDRLGLYVWSEMGAAYEFSGEGAAAFSAQWTEIVQQNYNHPSIITWVPFNESWGIQDVGREAQQQHFTEGVYHLTKTLDSMRPVIVNDGWEHTVSDIITLHSYEMDPELFYQMFQDHMDDILSGRMAHNGFKYAFAQGYSYRGQPVLISEFGGIALKNDSEGWGYGDMAGSKEEYCRRFDAIVTAAKHVTGFCGYCYTQITDVQQEINGILDEDRQCKVDPEVIREINERFTGVYQNTY